MLIVEFMVTEKCNLGCTYCYMANRKKFMTVEIVDKFLDTIGDYMDIYNQENYHISYFGGEPLLNWPILEYAIPKFDADPRCTSQVVISNGLELTEHKVEFMKKYNVGISLSFDGIWNDETRPMHDGTPSFDKYIEKKDLIKQMTNGCKVIVDPNTISTLTENYKFFTQEYGFSTPDFSLVRDDVWSDEDVELYAKEIRRLGDEVIKDNLKNDSLTNVGLFWLYTIDWFVNKKQGKRKFSCFAGSHGAGYTTDGKYYACARFASEDNKILMDAVTNEINQENVDFFKQPKISNTTTYEECQGCELYEVCNTQCLHSMITNGKEERAKPIENLCKILKLSYKESLRVFKELKDVKHYTDQFSLYYK